MRSWCRWVGVIILVGLASIWNVRSANVDLRDDFGSTCQELAAADHQTASNRNGDSGSTVLHQVTTVASYEDREEISYLSAGDKGFHARLLLDSSGGLHILWSPGRSSRLSQTIPRGIYQQTLGVGGWGSAITLLEPESGMAYLIDAQPGPTDALSFLWSEFAYQLGKEKISFFWGRQAYFGRLVGGRVIEKTAVLDDAAAGVWGWSMVNIPSAFFQLGARNRAFFFWFDQRESHRRWATGEVKREMKPRYREYDHELGTLGPVSPHARPGRYWVTYLAGASGSDGKIHISWLRDGVQYRRYEEGEWTKAERVMPPGGFGESERGFTYGHGMTVDGRGEPVIAVFADTVVQGRAKEALWIARRNGKKWAVSRWFLPSGWTLEDHFDLRAIGEAGSDTVHFLFQPLEARDPRPVEQRDEWFLHRPLVYACLRGDRLSEFRILAKDTKPYGIDLAQDRSGTLHFVWNERDRDTYLLRHATLGPPPQRHDHGQEGGGNGSAAKPKGGSG